jgi:O-antigen/teichoic acid export membrane protein
MAIRESTREVADAPTDPPAPADRGQARLLATGSLAQQLSGIAGLLALFLIVTVLARRLTLEEFGVYGLLTSLAGYLLVIQNSAASAAVRNMAAATNDEARDRAFSTATLIYAAAGLITGILLAVVGIVLSAAVDLEPDVETQARLGSLLIGLVTAVGWPITIYRDALRASQLFVRAAVIEIVSLVIYGALVLGLTFAGASLAVLIAVSGTIPLLAGLGAAASALRRGLPYRFRLRAATRKEAREFAKLAWYVSLTEAAGTIIYALDRVILGVFKSAATVGLYEGPVRAHNLLRALNGALSVTVLPTSARYFAEGDERRLEHLLVRGSRYILALVVPLTVTMMVLAPVILEVWLGPEFREGGTAMAILMSYWLVSGTTGVLQGIVVSGGRAPVLARLAWTVALSNLAISLALTPSLGLEGVTIGTAVPYIAIYPFFLRVVLKLVPTVKFRDLAREAFMPAYVLGAVLAAALAAARILLDLDSVIPLVAVSLGGLAAFWLAYYVVWLRPEERTLVRDVAGGALPWRRG